MSIEKTFRFDIKVKIDENEKTEVKITFNKTDTIGQAKKRIEEALKITIVNSAIFSQDQDALFFRYALNAPEIYVTATTLTLQEYQKNIDSKNAIRNAEGKGQQLAKILGGEKLEPNHFQVIAEIISKNPAALENLQGIQQAMMDLNNSKSGYSATFYKPSS